MRTNVYTPVQKKKNKSREVKSEGLYVDLSEWSARVYSVLI